MTLGDHHVYHDYEVNLTAAPELYQTEQMLAV